MDPLDRYAALIADRNRLVILVLLVATLVVGSAAGSVDTSLSIAQFRTDSPARDALDDIDANFDTGPANQTVLQVVVRDENVLSKDSLLDTLRLQRRLRANATVDRTLVADRPVADLATLVALAAHDGEGPPPGLDEQIATVESMSQAEVETTVERVLQRGAGGEGPSPYAFLPTDYEIGSGTADARLVLVVQQAGPDAASDPSPDLIAAQLATEELARQAVAPSGDAFAFGVGIVTEESTRATGDSFAVIGPLALLLIVGILAVAYRDALDVLLGLVGIGLVLVWMQGVMGWLGIDLTQILIAVPFLLVGLSIDYALHVVMRYRESQTADRDVRTSMRVGLAEVVLAVAAATVTTAVGFAANLVSPIGPIREFGLVSATGILSAFVVFGALVPAIKVELDERLARWRAWRRPAFGVDTPRVTAVLNTGSRLAGRAPVAVLVVALVLSAGGVYGAANTDTTFSQEAFLPTDTPGWMESLPEPFAPGDYDLRSNADYLNDRFARFGPTARTEILIEGPVATPAAFERVARAERAAGDADSTLVLSSGEPGVTGPVATVQALAERNATVAAALDAADTDGDGVPDRNVTGVLDAAYRAGPDAMDDVVARSGGDYRSMRLSIAVRGGVPPSTAAADARAVAAVLETDTGGGRLTATATGQPVLTALVQDGLLRTLVEAFLVTLVVIGLFLAALYRWRHGTAALGLLTLVPVLMALAWILGSMYLLGLNFTTETAVITSIAIGLGVDYSIHVAERFVLERSRTDTTAAALRATVQGTGGALLGSAATTTAGFGVLTLALVPSLQRFGIVTGLTIVYAFVASVVVLPSVLVLWTEWTGGTTA